MNKKLVALMMVPVVGVMGGTFAFSAWAGSANAFFGQTTATVSYMETLSFTGTNANMNPLNVSNGHTSVTVDMNTANFVVSSSSGSAGSVLNVYANVSYLVPGQYVNFTVAIKNTGNAVLNASTVSWSSTTGVNAFNGLGEQLSGPQSTYSFFQPPITFAYLTNVVNNGIPGIEGGLGPLFLNNATSTTSTPPYLTPGATLTYNIIAVLPNNAPTSYADFPFDVEISIPISTVV
jgi:hypothetical protein